MKRHIFGIFLLSLISFTSQIHSQKADGPSMQLTNGLWFNGTEFVQRTVWVKDRKLQFSAGNHVYDTIIDLTNQFIIPPFAEAHNHNLESDYNLESRIKKYLDNGVFYVKHLSSIKKKFENTVTHHQ